MSIPEPFDVTPEAFQVVASLLQRHPDLQAGLTIVAWLESLDEKGTVEGRFELESFWMAYDRTETFSQWNCAGEVFL